MHSFLPPLWEKLRWLYSSLFAQKPEQQKERKQESIKACSHQYYPSDHTCTSCLLNVHTHAPVTRPVSSYILFSVCLLSGEAVWSQPLWPWSNVWRSSWRLSMPLSTWMDRQDVPAGSVGHRMPALLYLTIVQQIALCLQTPPTQSGAKQSNSAHRYILGPWRFLSIPPSCCLETTYQWAKIPFSLAFLHL